MGLFGKEGMRYEAEIIFEEFARVAAEQRLPLADLISRAEVFDWTDAASQYEDHLYAPSGEFQCDLPFPVIFISMGNRITKFTHDSGTEKSIDFRHLGLLVWEVSPGIVDVAFMAETGGFVMIGTRDMVPDKFASIFHFVELFFDDYRSCILGYRSAGRHKFKVKADGQTAKEDRYRIVKSVVVLARRNRLDAVVSPRPIDWSHRFTVRGHWRVHEGGKGKNRSGERVVVGFTWVAEHEKGPEGAPLLRKARLVSAAQQPEET